MKKVVILGLEQDKESVLQVLQRVGVVHLEPISPKDNNKEVLIKTQNLVYKALEILKPYQSDRELSSIDEDLDSIAECIITDYNAMQYNISLLDDLQNQLDKLKVWGNFSTKLLQTIAENGLNFQFWECTASSAKKFPIEKVIWKSEDNLHFVTIAPEKLKIEIIGVDEVFFERGPVEIKEEYDEIKNKIALQQKFLQDNAIFRHAFEEYAVTLSNQMLLEDARTGTLEKQEIFGIQGWIPERDTEKLETNFKKYRIVLQFSDPQDNEEPPTFIQNPKWIQSIIDVVKIYAIPGYKEWDTSASIYFAFSIFFAMIIGDGGYGAIILALMLKFRKKLLSSDLGARLYRLTITLSTMCIVYGVLTCTFFSVNLAEISENSPFAFLRCMRQVNYIPSNDNNAMMIFSIYVGIVHLSIARFIQMIRLWGSSRLMAELGWIISMWGAVLYLHLNNAVAPYLLGIGVALIVLFTSDSKNFIKRIVDGIFGLTGITQTFSDVLSYLRLFALGLASAVMGQVFNSLGTQIQASIPNLFGTILMILVVFCGHTINLGLGIMSGVIHGLRLNFLEFYRYCFEGTGHDYQPFQVVKK
jgi:V/A-type H+-transporting ATPase subunit I